MHILYVIIIININQQCTHEKKLQHNSMMQEQTRPKDEKETSNEPTLIEQKIVKINGETVIKKYSKGKVLGRGGFAKCYEVTNLDTKKVLAAKIITKASLGRSRAKQKLISEIKIHKSLHHQNIVQFQHVFQDHQNVYILLELCSNQTLNELIKRRKRLTQIEVQSYLAQIVNALKYLHQHKVIHRDLKLGNLFVNENMQIKLGDFGLATKLEYEGEKKKTICGTPNYIAPEILEGKGHSYEVDIWSVGVIIYTQLIGKPPFETPEVKATYKKIRAGQYSFPEHVQISEHAKNLITKILVLDPAKRPTLDEIMQHPFMTTYQIPKTLPRSTLACPPSKGYVEQFQKTFESQPKTGPMSVTPSQSKLVVKEGREYSPDRALIDTGMKPSISNNAVGLGGNEEMMGTGSNFRASSKQLKPSQSNKIMPNSTGSNFNTVQPARKEKVNNYVYSELHVKKWVDYSTKYGLGYLLSDGSTGVYFNDSTKIILDAKGETLDYIEKKPNERVDTVSTYTLNDYPKEREFQKKVTLLQHFRNYLYADSKIEPRPEDDRPREGPMCYVKKWMKTRHAIMFRLSNKIVQVNFTDKTEIILSSEQKLVTYVNTKNEKSEYPLATALDSRNVQMAKRLKYTKEILTHMLNGTSPSSNPIGGPTQEQNPTGGPISNQGTTSTTKTGSSWGLK